MNHEQAADLLDKIKELAEDTNTPSVDMSAVAADYIACHIGAHAQNPTYLNLMLDAIFGMIRCRSEYYFDKRMDLKL